MALPRSTRAQLLPGLILAAALALTACGKPPPPATVPDQLARSVPKPPLRGYDIPSPTLGAPIPGDPLQDLQQAHDLGANVVRLAMSWNWLEPAGPTLDAARAAQIDGLMQTAQKLKLGVIFTVLGTPCWASSAPRTITGECDPAAHAIFPPKEPAAYGSFVKTLVARWGQGLSGVEVWNEPNTPSFWRGSPQQYVELVHAAAEGVRTSPYADVPVVGGAVSGSDLAYLGVLFDAGIAQWTDAISVHPYDVRFGAEGYSDPSLARDGDIWSYAFGVPHVHDLMVARGDTDPLWITEFGYPNCPGTPHCVTPELQADYLAKAAELAESWPYVDLFMVYRLRDWVPEDGTMEAHFGVLNQDYSQKPAAQALAPIFKKWKTPAP